MTLSTLAHKQIIKNRRKIARNYIISAVLCGVFAAIYEYFSHQVYSGYMIFAFLFPLIGGAVPFFLLSLSKIKMPGRMSRSFYHSGIATLTVGSIFQGVLDIYGTTNQLIVVYWYVGIVLIAAALILYIKSLLS